MLPVLFAALLLLPQGVPPPLPPPPGGAAEDPAQPVLDVDGDPCEPGKLPRSTVEAARAAWDRLVAASRVEGAAREPVRAFRLEVDLRLRAAENRSNDLPDASYAWLAPNYLKADTGRGRMHLRGPKGDWLVDAKASDARALVRLDVGRENAEDRRQIEESLDVARLFVGLVDPASVRVQSFVALPAPPLGAPPACRELAQKLAWFELRTPDVRPGPQNQVGARLLLGVDAQSGLPRLALADDVRAAAAPTRTSSCIDLDRWEPLDGWRVPHKILVYLPRLVVHVPAAPPEGAAQGSVPAEEVRVEGWRAEPAMELVVKRASLRPGLKPEDFLPPEPQKVGVKGG